MEIGEKIRRLRILNNLTQEELADRAELSKGFISQLERDLTSPSIVTLMDILQCLGTTPADFFSEKEPEQLVFRKTDYFEKQDSELKNHICWLIPNAQKNMMEPILLTLEPGGRMAEDAPHAGEEFGYVLSGSLELHLGNETRRVKRARVFTIAPKRITMSVPGPVARCSMSAHRRPFESREEITSLCQHWWICSTSPSPLTEKQCSTI